MAELTCDDGGVVRSPDFESLDDEALEHWRERSKTAKNPMMRARYADLMWDFGKLLGDAKRDYAQGGLAWGTRRCLLLLSDDGTLLRCAIRQQQFVNIQSP